MIPHTRAANACSSSRPVWKRTRWSSRVGAGGKEGEQDGVVEEAQEVVLDARGEAGVTRRVGAGQAREGGKVGQDRL